MFDTRGVREYTLVIKVANNNKQMTEEQFKVLSEGLNKVLEQTKEMVQMLNACTSCAEPVIGPEKGECQNCAGN